MDRKKTIHSLRCRLAVQRQPVHEPELKTLLLAVPPSDHPYRDSKQPECYSRLLGLPEFRWPSRGMPAVLSSATYLFHLRTLEGFFNSVKVKQLPQDPFPIGAIATVNLEKIVQILDDASRDHLWIPLDLIAEGLYETADLFGGGRRFITWWTDLVIDQDNVLRDAHRMGIPDNWLSSDCILLRCQIDSEIRAQARIPSILDGFASEIFLPCGYAGSPSSGRAIDIGATPFELGSAEVVLGPIEVNQISIRPIKIPRTAALPSYVDSASPSFLQRLELFYRANMA